MGDGLQLLKTVMQKNRETVSGELKQTLKYLEQMLLDGVLFAFSSKKNHKTSSKLSDSEIEISQPGQNNVRVTHRVKIREGD